MTSVSDVTPASRSVGASYIYCDTLTSIWELREDFRNWSKEPIFVDCEGLDLGRSGGKLGLVQLGIGEKIYLVDPVACPDGMTTMKYILEDSTCNKVVWDGRNDFSELWHGPYTISMNPVIDLQLVYVRLATGGRKGSRGFVKVEGMDKAFEKLERTRLIESGIDLERFAEVHNKIKRRHFDNETDFWIQRPLGPDERDYAAFDIMQLQTLFKACHLDLRLLSPEFLVNIREESRRYVELYLQLERPPAQAWHLDHPILPQEILSRSPEIQRSYDDLGTKVCGRCQRALHQDSFPCPFPKWQRGQICHTCVEASRLNKNRTSHFDRFQPISFDWYKDYKNRESKATSSHRDDPDVESLRFESSRLTIRRYDSDEDYNWDYEDRELDKYDPDEDSDFGRRALD